jgi:hypothetical protein
MNKSKSRYLPSTAGLIFISLFFTSVISCGGGGGGGSNDIGSSELFIEPATIEVGGNQEIRIKLRDVKESLNLKIAHPDALSFVENSARFFSAEAEVVTNPAFNLSEDQTTTPEPTATPAPGVTVTPAPTATATATPTPTATGTAGANAAAKYTKRYLVFFLTRDAFGNDDSGELVLKLRAKEVLDSGKVELDIDIDDPSIPNDQEFSVQNPQFEAEKNITIRVRN